MNKELIGQIRKLGQQYAYDSIQMHELIAQRAGLSGTDHKYLGFLIVNGKMTAGELGALSGLTSGAVTGLIDRFEKKKLVKREFAKEDRRKVFIVPDVKKIMALLEPLFKDFGTKTEKLIASFSEKEIRVIERYLSGSIGITNETKNAMRAKAKNNI
ncbi:MAG: MarR family transcriptional regulator [Bacteroidia bacterium]|nr:MarR family transcriptional regulator [Bacteroidia bacterium]